MIRTALLTLSIASTSLAADWPLTEIGVDNVIQGWGSAKVDRSVGGKPMRVGGQTFDRGLGTHSEGEIAITLDGKARRFVAKVGVDEEEMPHVGSVEFIAAVDGKIAWRSGVMKSGEAAKECSVDLADAKSLVLSVTDGGDDEQYDHADWAEAKIEYDGVAPRAEPLPAAEEAIILTPPPPKTPRINGPKVIGVRHSPILFRVPATGERPMTFSLHGVPDYEKISIDESSGIIRGDRPHHPLTLLVTAKNASGEASRELRIEVGDRLALTPPMGWNSWNCFAGAVDQTKIAAAAEAIETSGLIDHGWAYVNIDDCWQTKPGKGATPPKEPRDAAGKITVGGNFPDMKELVDSIHARGLKAGIYSSPGPLTCAGFVGSYGFEELDARQYAEWGFDFLKYDWCSYGAIAATLQDQLRLPRLSPLLLRPPYLRMGEALKKTNRDIVYSLCQYGMGDVSAWGNDVGGHAWRTTGDIVDTWSSVSKIGFAQSEHAKYARPGNWNDPDMLVVGKVGWGGKLHSTRLTPNEQYAHISLWCLLSSPLLIGCDLTQLDPFTLSLLTNDEVLAVNQDPLGQQATRRSIDGKSEVWAKELEDGSLAVGLFNRGPRAAKVTAKFDTLGRSGKQAVRDLWRQKDLGAFDGEYSVEVPRHGVVLVRLSKP